MVQLGIGAVQRQQLLMGALLGDDAVLHHQDAVGLADGAEPVGNDQRGASGGQLVKGVLDLAEFIWGVK